MGDHSVLNACKITWDEVQGTYVGEDEVEAIDDEWFDHEASMDLDVKCELVEEMVVKDEEGNSDDELGEWDEGDQAVIMEGANLDPLPPRSRNQNPNVCRISGHKTTAFGQSRPLPCGLTPQPSVPPPPPPAS